MAQQHLWMTAYAKRKLTQQERTGTVLKRRNYGINGDSGAWLRLNVNMKG